jgi:hypothetical protein
MPIPLHDNINELANIYTPHKKKPGNFNYSMRSILLVTNLDVYRHNLYRNTSILARSNNVIYSIDQSFNMYALFQHRCTDACRGITFKFSIHQYRSCLIMKTRSALGAHTYRGTCTTCMLMIKYWL